MDEALRKKIDSLPGSPGVYLMKDRDGRVIYVGKAVDLRERVRSYLVGADKRAFVPLLDRLLGDVEAIVVDNEKEALLLENELIRRHRPRFNVRPRAGRNFVYLRIDPRRPYPRLEVTRQVRDDGARYFGPYPLARALRDTLRVVNRHFRLRTCSDHDALSHKRPCLLCQIARFPSPSVYDIPEEEYRRHVEGAILFLQGRRRELIDRLVARMDEAAAARRFEEAARIRDQLAAIERTLQPQEVVSAGTVDQDAFGYCRAGARLAVYALYVRQGRIAGGEAFSFERPHFADSEILASFLNLYYTAGRQVPDEVLLPFGIDGREALAEILAERRGASVRVLIPRRGARHELVRMSQRNAAEAAGGATGRRAEEIDELASLARLQQRLGLKRLPRHMECFDVSHFHGAGIVASRAAMTDGRPDKDRYRRYRIASVEVGDDYGAMYEAVSRRLSRGLRENDLPDLIVVDGGKPQLAAAQAAMRDLGITGVEAVAIAKARELPAGPGPAARRERLPDRLYLPGRSKPLVVPEDSPELLLLGRLRDEAHRFAVTYQRKLMRRERTRSRLESVPGVGALRRKALLRHFGSLRAIEGASAAQLAEVEGVGPALASKIHGFLHKGAEEPDGEAQNPLAHSG